MAGQAPVTGGAEASAGRRRLLPAAVFIAALAVRLLYAFTWGGEHHRNVAGDAAEYQTYAVNLLDRGVYENALGERASRMPGYPLLAGSTRPSAGPRPWSCSSNASWARRGACSWPSRQPAGSARHGAGPGD